MLLVQVIARGQLAAPVAPASDKNSDTVTLSPFVVQSTQDTGYRVHDTLAGTRLRSNVDDIGVALTEVPKDLMNDLAITDVMSMVGFLPSTTAESTQVALGDGSGQFRSIRMNIRGIFSEQIGRNFFSSPVGEYMPPLDPYNTERFTLSAGANSILFGNVTPAGLVNFSTEQANLSRDSARLTYTTDSYGTQRIEGSVNSILIPNKLAVRVNFLDAHKKGWKDTQYYDQKRLYAAVDWKPAKNTTITANLEGGLVNNNTPFPTPMNDKFSLWLANGSHLVPYSATVNPATKAPGVVSAAGANTTNILLGSGLPASQSVQNFKFYAESAMQPVGVLQGANSPEAPYLVDPKFVIGNSRINDRHILVGDVEVEQKVTDDLYVQLAYFYNHQQKFVGSTGNNNAYVDASSTLNNGSANPNAGRFFTNGGTANLQDFLYTNATYRATVSYHLDLAKVSPWLGHTDFAGLLERNDELRLTNVNRLQNVTPLPGYSTSIVNAQNSIQPVFYFDPASGNRASSQELNVLNYPTLFSQLPGVTARWTQIGPGTDSLSRLGARQIAAQSFWLKDRLVTTLGYRVDTMNTWDVLQSNWVVHPDGTYASYHGGELHRTFDPLQSNINQPTHSAGAVFHLVKNWKFVDLFSLTYNSSTNFQSASTLPTFSGLPIGPSSGKTKDMGFATTLFNNTFNFKLSYYESAQQSARLSNAEFSTVITDYYNMWTAIAAANPSYSNRIFPNTNLTDTYDIATHGIEWQGTYQPTPNLSLALYGSRTIAVRSNVAPNMQAYVAANQPLVLQFPNVNVSTSSGVQTVSQVVTTDNAFVAQELATNGRSQPEQSEWKFSLIGNYRFLEGALKGFNAGGYVNWMSKPIIGTGWLNAKGSLPDYSQVYYGAVSMDTGAFVAYTKQLGRHVKWKIQLNVRNLLNNTKLQPIRADEGYGLTGIQQNIDWRYVEPRSFILTNRFEF